MTIQNILTKQHAKTYNTTKINIKIFHFRSKGKLDTGKVGKKKTLKNGNSIDDYSNDLGTSLLMKPRTPMMGRKSPMLGRKSPMVDRKAIEKNKTPAMMK